MSTRKKGQSLTDKVIVFFRLEDPIKNKYKCLIENCKESDLSGDKKWNLVSHVKTQHKSFFNHTFGNYQTIAVKKYSLSYRRLKQIQNCVEIVAVNANPFTILHESGVGGLLQDELDASKICGFGDGLGRPNYVAN